MLNDKPHSFLFYSILLMSLVTYVFTGYCVQRQQFFLLLCLFGLLFSGYFYLIHSSLNGNFIQKAIWASILFRMTLLLMLPNLSDDCYRFIWDGRLSAQGSNPFSFLPSAIASTPATFSCHLDAKLYALLNSKNYYTVYPPLLQGVFYTAAKVFPDSIKGSIIILRLFIIGAETASIVLLLKLLKKMRLPPQNVLLYALNPLVIFELTGNLHFEAFMILFLLLFFYFFIKKWWISASVAFSLAVASKLLPLIFFPFLIKRLGLKRFILFTTLCFALICVFFVPFFSSNLLLNLGASLRLYFQVFEFNGSLFYLLRWLGFRTMGYDLIGTVGKVIPLLVAAGICLMAYFNNQNKPADQMKSMLFALSFYLAFASIVHSWYIAPLIAITVFTRYRYSIIWSALIFLTYSAYSYIPYKENYWLLSLEYVLVYGYAFYELISGHDNSLV